jgi:large subunit ribosomal protein L10
MKQEEKVASIADLVGDFGRATVTVVVDYRGLSAGEFDDVRRAVRAPTDGAASPRTGSQRAIAGMSHRHAVCKPRR